MVEVVKGVVGVEVMLFEGGGGVVLPDARGRVAAADVEIGWAARVGKMWAPGRVNLPGLRLRLGWGWRCGEDEDGRERDWYRNRDGALD